MMSTRQRGTHEFYHRPAYLRVVLPRAHLDEKMCDDCSNCRRSLHKVARDAMEEPWNATTNRLGRGPVTRLPVDNTPVSMVPPYWWHAFEQPTHKRGR